MGTAALRPGGQYEHAGVLGELVVQADRASVAQELGGDPARAMAAPKHALQRKLLDGLRYLLKEELKLNQPEASDGWLTEDALWLVSKTVSDKLRAHLLSQGIDGIPANNTAVFNVLQDHGMLQPTGREGGLAGDRDQQRRLDPLIHAAAPRTCADLGGWRATGAVRRDGSDRHVTCREARRCGIVAGGRGETDPRRSGIAAMGRRQRC